ncbi:aldo/keto reductase [Rothia sp. AR01]|uniref:Aldo/keto reductase n=1 Tax=Rothia santali TaxID=2949643 RepID=A0A9X2HC79_9MICC|nr:aldo/keto reductase [Rothia santali]MCP3426696.1 aldo/keto reductase [Rothia santali]
MTHRNSIPRTNLSIFPLNLGGNTFGWTSDREGSFAVLDAFVEAGGNFIDTADVYSAWAEGHSGGESETVLGEWLSARGRREDVVIATKAGQHPEHSGQARDTVHQAIDASLNRLQTDYVDLYYAHFDDEDVPVEDQARTYDEIVQSGKARHIGISNYSPERMRRWFEYAYVEQLALPVAIQPHYNLVTRKDFESGYAPIAREFDAAVFPYFSLASGFLTGKYRSLEDLRGIERQQLTEGYFSEEGLAVVAQLREIAERRDVEIPSVALAWLLAKGVTAPIASARTTEQLPALLEGASLSLTGDEVAALDRASAPFA